MSEPYVLWADHGPVVVLTLNRPERRNALSRTVIDPLSDVLDQIDFEPAHRVVVLTGAGPVFCAGMDLEVAVAQIGTPEAEKHAETQHAASTYSCPLARRYAHDQAPAARQQPLRIRDQNGDRPLEQKARTN